MTEPNRQSGENEERIIEIEIERLRPFKEHPFQVKGSLRRNSSYPDQRQDYSTQYHHTGRKKLQSLFRIPTY